jgi:isoleucyl-tRNA synthetase
LFHKLIELESDLNKESIHFVRIPECNEGLIDEKIEEKVERMQRVIELGRVIRDRGKTPLKFPLQVKNPILHNNLFRK